MIGRDARNVIQPELWKRLIKLENGVMRYLSRHMHSPPFFFSEIATGEVIMSGAVDEGIKRHSLEVFMNEEAKKVKELMEGMINLKELTAGEMIELTENIKPLLKEIQGLMEKPEELIVPYKTALEMSPTALKQYHPFSVATKTTHEGALCDEARKLAKDIAVELVRRFGAVKVMLFGSLVRDDFHRWSDIDLAVWGIPPADYYRAVAFAAGFSRAFEVDLVDAEDCSESLKEHIMKEGVEL